jgi:pterin-4a-carbinolamine dehydratase
MKFFGFEVKRVHGKKDTKKKENYRSLPIWKYIKRSYGFKNFDQGFMFVVLHELYQKMEELKLTDQLEEKKPKYIV